ncbi:MAG: NAD(P)-dependent oxidoreductase [Aggregatilineales bacterium]
MPEKLKVLFLLHPLRSDFFSPWGEDVVTALGGRHDLHLLKPGEPLPPEYGSVDVVVEHGGHSDDYTRRLADRLAGKIRLWQVLGTGLDKFDLGYWRAKKIPVANTPGQFSSVALSEHALMFILMLARKFPVAQSNLKTGVYYEPMCIELEGLTLAIVGFGASGRELARRARAFGMKIQAIDIRDIGANEVHEFGLEFVGKPSDIDRVLTEADVVSVHLHLNPETHHIIDKRRLALMKPTAFLINVARGALVDENALTDALVNGHIGGAGLDVFGQEPPDLSSPIFNLPNVIATPHTSGMTTGTSKRRAQCVADNIDRIAAGLEPLYRVD